MFKLGIIKYKQVNVYQISLVMKDISGPQIMRSGGYFTRSILCWIWI